MNIDLDTLNILRAFLLTAFAGLSTGLGGLVVLRKKEFDSRALSISLGLSAGVMIYISFVEMLAESFGTMKAIYGEGPGGWGTILAFFAGIGIIAVIDHLVPEETNPHEMAALDHITAEEYLQNKEACSSEAKEGEKAERKEKQKLFRTGILSVLAISIHNFPEGIASFFAALQDPALGISIAIAIAIHNIPEGISVAVPIKQATGSNSKAIGLATLSGLAEPLGALLGYLFLRPYLSEALLAIIFALVAGIMVYISLDELLPAAQKLEEHHHHAMAGLIIGMAIMAVTLQLT